MAVPTVVCRGLLAAFLLTSGSAKVLSGYTAGYAISPLVYYAACTVEFIGAGLIVSRRWRIASLIAIALASIGLLVTILQPHGGCGCLGRLTPSDWRLQLALSGTLGCLGVLSLTAGTSAEATAAGSAACPPGRGGAPTL